MRIFFRTIPAAFLLLAIALTVPFVSADDISQSWNDDYERIEREITQYSEEGTEDLEAEQLLPIMDRQARIFKTDRDPLDVHLRRLAALLDYMDQVRPSDGSHNERDEYEALANRCESLDPSNPRDAVDRHHLFMESRELARTIAFQNPLIDFDAIIFNTFEHQIEKNNIMNHDQDVGYSARPGGGIGVIRDFMTDHPTGRNLLDGIKISNGPYQGLEISTACGSFNSYDLSFDGTKIVFAWSRRGKNPWDTWTPYESEFWIEENTFHLFSYEVGAPECVQLTFGNRSDHSPCWLPNGRIAFMSERRNTTARCAGSRHQPTCTLHSIHADGTELIPLSWHDTEEWDPSVTNDGMIVYTRWDYLDRDFHIAHHLWTCYPDGRDPRAPHGNYPLPHTTLVGEEWEDGRAFRPWGEYNIRAIPDSSKFIAIAGGHHHTGIYGAPIIIDVAVPDNNRTSQVKRIIAGNQWIHESHPSNYEGGKTEITSGNVSEQRHQDSHYGYPWPLSEDFYLVVEGEGTYDRIFLLDKFGNREMLYSDFSISNVSGFRVVSPRPYRARVSSPIIPEATTQRTNTDVESPGAVISVMNVYESDFEWPDDTKIQSLRIIQHVPKPWSSPVTNQPRMGYSRSPTGRVILGTVPVEDDGSAYFEAPVERLIYFQAIDENGMAVQSMRSGTYVHPGEHLSCVGCHEDRWRSTNVRNVPLAMQRPPSRIAPEVGGVEPVNFYRLVQPVFGKHCVDCHEAENHEPDFSYDSLEPYAFYFHADGGANHMSWLHGGSRTIAGMFGARWSRLYREGYLSESHYGVSLSQEELRRITLWLDANSLEMPSFSLDNDTQANARRGELVWPILDVDPANPLGVEFK
jgi:hypothetical protein